MNEPEKYVPIEKVAKHINVSISTIRAWVRQGKIPKSTYMKMSTTIRFKLSAVEAALLAADDDEPEEKPEVKQPISLY